MGTCRAGFLLFTGALSGGLLLQNPGGVRAAVTVKTVTYNGWKGAQQLSNGTVEIVVVPQIGRIMRYGFAGGANVLWNNAALNGKTTDLNAPGKDWINYGGDKLWPAPQERWGWPPDRLLDSGAQTIKALPNHHLLLTGPVVKALGIQFRREIALDETGSGVTITNTLVNTGTADVDWSIWQVAQIDNPSEARLMRNPQGRFPNGFFTFSGMDVDAESLTATDTVVTLKRHATQSAKIGVDSPTGQLQAVTMGGTFTFTAHYEMGATYPDSGCAQQIYTNPDPNKYVELELLGPMLPLKPNASRVFVTHWSLTK